MSRAAAFICRLPIYLRFELLLSIASLRNFSQLYETCAVALAEQKRRVSRCYTHAAQRSAAAAVRLRRRRAAPTRQAHRRSLAAAPHTAAAPQPRARVPKFTVCAVVLSHRNAERTASSSGAAPAAAHRVHIAPAHGLLPVLAHTLHALPYIPEDCRRHLLLHYFSIGTGRTRSSRPSSRRRRVARFVGGGGPRPWPPSRRCRLV